MVLAFLFALSTFVLLEITLSTDEFVLLYIGIKPKFITVSYLCGSWLNLVEVLRYVYNVFRG